MSVSTSQEAPVLPEQEAVPAARRWWRAALGIVMLAGFAAVVRVWAFDRGYWNDELYIALNLKHKSFVGLAGPLIQLQVAPPGWLVVERALYLLSGGDERVLNLPQLLSAFAVITLTALVARKAIGRWAAVLATALVVLSPFVLYYAGELKQYEIEAACALLTILCGGVLGTRALAGTLDRRTALLCGVGMLAATGFSYTSLMVTGGTVGGVLLTIWLNRSLPQRPRALLRVLLISSPALLYSAFQILLRLQISFPSNQDDFFPNGLPPSGSRPHERFGWIPQLWNGFVAKPMHWQISLAVIVLIVLGLVLLARRGRLVWALILTGILGAVFAAAFMDAFPMEDRVATYLIAPVILTVVAAVDGLARLAVQAPRGLPKLGAAAIAVVAALGLAVVAAPAAQGAVDQVREPFYRDRAREMIADVGALQKPGDVVIWYAFTSPAADWYGSRYGLKTVSYAGIGPCSERTSFEPVLAGATRVWYLRGAKFSEEPEDVQARVLAGLVKYGTITDSRVYGPGTIFQSSPGWAVIDLTLGPDPSPPAYGPTEPRFECARAIKIE